MPGVGARYFVDTLNNKELITVMGCKVKKPPVEPVRAGCKGGGGEGSPEEVMFTLKRF